jgi:hypothetical protein
MSLRITSVEPLDEYRLRLTFNDGAVTEADFSGDLRGPLAEPLRDPAYFRQVRIDDEAHTIVWPNGLDPDPYVLHGDHLPAAPSSLRVRRLDTIAGDASIRSRRAAPSKGRRAPAAG